MAPSLASIPDWQDASAYAALVGADRSLIAWEWLRRDLEYRRAADCGSALAGRRSNGPEAFGLHAFEPVECAVPQARPMWTKAVHPFVLTARASAARGEDETFDVGRFADLASLHGARGDKAQHLLLSDGYRTIRIDVSHGSISGGPVRLNFVIQGVAGAAPDVLSLGRLMALDRSMRFARGLHPCERRARRWVMLLRAHDALATGADYRAIATHLVATRAADPRWRTRLPGVRAKTQRLVWGARAMAAGGFRDLLR